MTLASLGLTKRATAWVGLAAILVVFLLVPAGRVLDLPWSGNDRLWNPGPVILAHQPIEQRCSACHQVAFQHVKDAACLECHAKVGHHVGAALQRALFDGVRCASCHTEHKGTRTTHRDDDRFCIDCHRDIHAKAQGTAVMNVSDFETDHPAVPAHGDGRSGRARAPGSRANPVRDNPSLAFPHDKHLDPAGVKSPAKGRVRLDCASCHRPDTSKRMFEPISMAKDCQECHRLEIEPAVTDARGAPRQNGRRGGDDRRVLCLARVARRAR